MLGQINDTAQLNGNGRTLLVSGWIGFADDEKSAVLQVTATQNGSTVTGTSTRLPSNKKAWAVELEGDDNFHPGSIHVEVTATVELRDGSEEEYPEAGQAPWSRYITLQG